MKNEHLSFNLGAMLVGLCFCCYGFYLYTNGPENPVAWYDKGDFWLLFGSCLYLGATCFAYFIRPLVLGSPDDIGHRDLEEVGRSLEHALVFCGLVLLGYGWLGYEVNVPIEFNPDAVQSDFILEHSLMTDLERVKIRKMLMVGGAFLALFGLFGIVSQEEEGDEDETIRTVISMSHRGGKVLDSRTQSSMIDLEKEKDSE